MDKELQEAINEAKNIAKHGTTADKENFVEWASEALQWLSYQGDKKGVEAVSTQYKAYLNALKEQHEREN